MKPESLTLSPHSSSVVSLFVCNGIKPPSNILPDAAAKTLKITSISIVKIYPSLLVSANSYDHVIIRVPSVRSLGDT
jgi:hypothetical protein